MDVHKNWNDTTVDIENKFKDEAVHLYVGENQPCVDCDTREDYDKLKDYTWVKHGTSPELIFRKVTIDNKKFF